MLRLAIPLLVANYIAFAAFVAVRPSDAAQLREKDAAWTPGSFSISSADPYTYLAARPLYNWSEWHAGEHAAVKVLEVANLPALMAAAAVTPVAGTLTGASVYHGRSWVRAILFVLFATLQWLAVAKGVRRVSRRPRTA